MSVSTREELTERALELIETNPDAFVAALSPRALELAKEQARRTFINMTKIQLMRFVGKYEPDEMLALMKRLEEEDALSAEEKLERGRL